MRVIAWLIGAHCLLMPTTAWAMPRTYHPPTLPMAVLGDDVADEAPVVSDQTRQDLLGLHQGLALATLAGLVTTGILGQVLTHQKLNNPSPEPFVYAHVTSAVLTSLLYTGAASAALFAPPPSISAPPSQGFDPMVYHRGLSWLHGLGIGSTVALGLVTLLQDPQLRTAHQVLGWTTTGLMAVSGGLIVFNF